jgi:integrase
MEIDQTQIWLDSVGKRSRKESTQYKYRKCLEEFLLFTGTQSASTIVEEHKKCLTLVDERNFKETYTDYISAFASHLESKGQSFNSVNTSIAAVKSFFKYRHLPLNYETLDTRKTVMYPDRDLKKEELVNILKIAKVRARAFFTFMAQSGLRPDTICQLQLKDIQPDFSKGVVPCCVSIAATKTKGAYDKYYSFIGPEAIEYLKTYLAKERPNISANDYIFAQDKADNQSPRNGLPACPKSFSREFNLILKLMKKSGMINYEVRGEGKPSELKLYSLRKYFERNASKASEKLAQYWMGHLSHLGVALSYLSRDVEEQRKIYKEKAMPELRLETFTPTEHEKDIVSKTQEIDTLKNQVADLTHRLEVATNFVQRMAPTKVEDIEALTLARMISKLQKDSGKSMKEFLNDFTKSS